MKEQADRRLTLNRRGLFMLVSLYGHLAVTKLPISIEWFRLFYFMKTSLISFLFLMVGLTTYADEATIVIKQKSGNETALELSTNPVITFSGEDMVITSNITTIMIPMDDIDDYVVRGVGSGIKAVTETPQFVDGNVVFSNIPKGTTVSIHALDGTLVRTQTVTLSGPTIVSLDQLNKGCYIISAGEYRIKVIKKQ